MEVSKENLAPQAFPADSSVSDKIQSLLTDPEFLKLKRSLSDSNLNLFSTLGVSHRELWHSAFVRWILDPQSDTGLGDFALKCFLHLALNHYETHQNPPDMSAGDLEGLNLESFQLKREFDIELLDEGEKRRIDVFGESQTLISKLSSDPKRLRIIIENKVLAGETNDQTEAYATWADNGDYDYNFLVFLTPDSEQNPKNKQFVKITYDQFYQKVLLPCLRHPDLNAKSNYWLEQYILNLGTTLKNGKPMANTRKEICEKIYKSHKSILDEIFVAVDEIGKLPNDNSETSLKQHIGVSLQQLVEKGVLDLTDTLHGVRNGKIVSAALVKSDDVGIGIVYNAEEYASPSRAAGAITGGSINGWKFWEVRSEAGKSKGTLDDLRTKVVQSK
jgi:hypothetical protein